VHAAYRDLDGMRGHAGEGAADMGVVQNQRRALYLQVFCEEIERIAEGDDAVATDADFVWRFRNACSHAQHVLNPSLIAPQLPAYIGVVWCEYESKLAAYAGTIWGVAVPEAVSTRHGAA
jgi:hypothetical protein